MKNDTAFSRQQMIEQQLRAWEVFDPRVLCAFDELPRERFVPERFQNLPFADTPIPLGHGETMMAPSVEGRLLQSLELKPTDHVLEVGTGSGWLTALLATLAGEVYSIDVIADFVEGARSRLAAAGVTNATLEHRDALSLDSETRRFDAIAVTGSLPEYSPLFERLLNPGGRLFAIVGEPPAMDARIIIGGVNGAPLHRSLFETSVAPLRGFAHPTRFAL